jgi:hypothetical protein
VAVRWIPTDQNWADIFTKPLAAEKFYQFWKQMCGYGPWQVSDGTTTAAGATQFEFVPIEFTHWQIDTADPGRRYGHGQDRVQAHGSPGVDVIASVLWTRLTSSTSDLGDGGASTDHENQQQCTQCTVPHTGTARSGVMVVSPQGGAHAIVNKKACALTQQTKT